MYLIPSIKSFIEIFPAKSKITEMTGNISIENSAKNKFLKLVFV